MKSFYLSLAVLALGLNSLEAASTSGLLRERNARRLEDTGTKGSKGKSGSKGKGKSSAAISPVCPGEETPSKSKGKGGKGKSTETRFLDEIEEANRFLSKGGKGKGKSSGGGGGCDCDPPTDLCEIKCIFRLKT